MVSVFCQNCGKQEERDRWKAERFKFCSRECRGKADQKKVILKCENCKKDFFCHNYRKDKARFCSHECNKSLLKSNCKNCEKEFYAKPLRGKPRTFCSLTCNKSFYDSKKQELICLFCNKKFIRPKHNIRNSKSYCSKTCFDISKTGKNKENFIIRRLNNKGYWIINLPEGGHILEHIKIMQESIGRKLFKNEVVHHINEIKTDNRLENLKLMDRAEHTSLHRNKEIYPVQIEVV